MLKYILIPVIVVAMGFVVVSLAKGIIAFLQSTRDDLESGSGPNGNDSGPSPMQLKQNEMMFARIKYQALAVIVVAVLLAVAR